jgi:sugar phosphate isomerase/epimerase
MITAISLCLFNNRIAGFQDILDIKKAGIKYFELDLPYFNQIFPGFIDFAMENMMGINSIHSNTSDYDLSGTHEDGRIESIEDLKKTVDMAVELNSRLVIVHPSASFKKGEKRKIRVRNCINSLIEVVKYASSNNIKIAIENNVSRAGLPILGEDIEELAYILKKVRDLSGAGNGIGICLDTGHAFLANTLFDSVDFFKNDILLIHLSDNNGRGDNIEITYADDSHLPPGFGKIDWKSFFNSLDNINYNETLVFEILRDHLKRNDTGYILEKIGESIRSRREISWI